MKDFGLLKKLDLRELWTRETSDFTPWLAEHLPALGEVLGMELELQRREAPMGDFSLDLLARDVGRDRLVIIENQLVHRPISSLYCLRFSSSAAASFGADGPLGRPWWPR